MKIFFFFFTILYTSSLFAESYKGTVTVLSSAIAPTILLKVTLPEAKEFPLCSWPHFDTQPKLAKLNGMIIETNLLPPTPGEVCFQTNGFQILKLPNGRAPIVGTLLRDLPDSYPLDEKKKGHTGDLVVAVNEKGERSVSFQASKGLIKLLGKKVIVDLVPSHQDRGGNSTKIVAFYEYP